MNYISVKNLTQKINYIVAHIVITVATQIIGMLVYFLYFMDILEEKKHILYIYIDFQTCMNIYIRLIIYSYFYLFKYSTNKLCIY
jgi:hypothetical protein